MVNEATSKYDALTGKIRRAYKTNLGAAEKARRDACALLKSDSNINATFGLCEQLESLIGYEAAVLVWARIAGPIPGIKPERTQQVEVLRAIKEVVRSVRQKAASSVRGASVSTCAFSNVADAVRVRSQLDATAEDGWLWEALEKLPL
jgi:hypothetical protein